MHSFSTTRALTLAVIGLFSAPAQGLGEYNEQVPTMFAMTRIGWFVLASLLAPRAAAAAEPVFFRLFLTDGSSLVSYGEFARINDRVIFSVVSGGGVEPRLQVATLPASKVDWPRTDRHAASTRYQWYARTRGEEDFLQLSNEVASVLNQVVQTRDRARALEAAQAARNTLADWPRAHYGYRQKDVAEVLGFLDEVISDLRAAAGATSFDLALVAVAPAPEVMLEPLATLPSPRDQVDQLLRIAHLTELPAERVGHLRTALGLIDASAGAIPNAERRLLRRRTEAYLKTELTIDERYTALARRLVQAASERAANARVDQVDRVLQSIPREDAKLGRHRPDTVRAIHASVQSLLDATRQLRLRLDRWTIRRSLYRDYERSVKTQIGELIKVQPQLEAIRRLDGPAPRALVALRGRLSGGAAQLDRITPPEDLRTTHDLLIGAWRFAESAVNGRYAAASAGDVGSAWQASSAAGGALMLLSRVQQEIRESLEPPTLQ
jgi:hypothetical protein